MLAVKATEKIHITDPRVVVKHSFSYLSALVEFYLGRFIMEVNTLGFAPGTYGVNFAHLLYECGLQCWQR